MEIKNKTILITGGAGFIGSSLVKRLLSNGNETHVIDNLSSGSKKNLDEFNGNKNFDFKKLDLLQENLNQFLDAYDIIFHLAANPEVRIGIDEPKVHLEQNVIATFNLLEAVRKLNPKKIVFTSSSTVYGEPTVIPTPENYTPMQPISTYGASKLACEALISSYAHSYGFQAILYRLANIIGEKSNHGVIFDFINKLKNDPYQLEVLGDGTQNKSYLYISDCIEAIEFGLKSKKRVDYFNIGSDDRIKVSTIGNIVIEEMNLKETKMKFTGGVDGGRGWKGDVKHMMLNSNYLKSFGWEPKYNSEESVRLTTSKMLNM